MFTTSTILILLMSSQIAMSQFWGTGGGFAGGFGGFGCGGQVQHFGSECYQPKTGQGVVICVGKSILFTTLNFSNVQNSTKQVYIFLHPYFSTRILTIYKRRILWWLRRIFSGWWSIVTWKLRVLPLQFRRIPVVENSAEKAR